MGHKWIITADVRGVFSSPDAEGRVRRLLRVDAKSNGILQYLLSKGSVSTPKLDYSG